MSEVVESELCDRGLHYDCPGCGCGCHPLPGAEPVASGVPMLVTGTFGAATWRPPADDAAGGAPSSGPLPVPAQRLPPVGLVFEAMGAVQDHRT